MFFVYVYTEISTVLFKAFSCKIDSSRFQVQQSNPFSLYTSFAQSNNNNNNNKRKTIITELKKILLLFIVYFVVCLIQFYCQRIFFLLFSIWILLVISLFRPAFSTWTNRIETESCKLDREFCFISLFSSFLF